MAKIDQSNNVIFLGIADHWQDGLQPFPLGAIDIYQISKNKSHIVYPGIISSQQWVFLISSAFLQKINLKDWSIQILDENNKELSSFKIHDNKREAIKNSIPTNQSQDKYSLIYKKTGREYVFLHFSIPGIIPHPGKYTIKSNLKNDSVEIDEVFFHYQKSLPLTPDQINAIESDPYSAKVVFMEFNCKKCNSRLSTYTGLNRSASKEKEGFIWQTDLEDEFLCQCGKTSFDLRYLRESMHGLLLKDFSIESTGLSYVRRYGHEQVTKTVKAFKALIEKEKFEQPIQRFIEDNPILLSRFSAKRLFIKPNIVGRFAADFAILDSENKLWFIELERPTLKLFKKDRHPSADLMHAFEQVNDWLQQYSKYSGAILDALGLKEKEIIGVNAAVIAGRKVMSIEVLQRFSLNPPYPNIEFFTLDDLGESLLTISRKLA